jgi:hypothetical protein
MAWTCRVCNSTFGFVFRRVGLGRRTRQFNPNAEGARSLGQWITAVLAMRGESDAIDVPAAVAVIHATPAEQRSRFAKEIWRIRRQRGH